MLYRRCVTISFGPHTNKHINFILPSQLVTVVIRFRSSEEVFLDSAVPLQVRRVFLSTMAVWEGKKYKMEKSENFDEYMKALGEWSSSIFPDNSIFACVCAGRLPGSYDFLSSFLPTHNHQSLMSPDSALDEELIWNRPSVASWSFCTLSICSLPAKNASASKAIHIGRKPVLQLEIEYKYALHTSIHNLLLRSEEGSCIHEGGFQQ